MPAEFDRFARQAASVLDSPEYSERERERADERQRELRAARARRLRGEAARAMAALKRPDTAARVEELIRDVGAGVHALAVWYQAYCEGRPLTYAERSAVSNALLSTALERALSEVAKITNGPR